MLLLSSADFPELTFSKNSFSNTDQSGEGYGSMNRTNKMLVLIWGQTVFKGYQQMRKVTANKEKVK